MGKIKHKAASLKQYPIEISDIDEYLKKYFWLIIPVLLLLYYFFSTFSDGFYGDDEIAYAMYMKRFFQDPASIIGNWNKPGYKLLFAIPSLFGQKILLISHIILTVISVLSVYYLGRQLKIKNSSIITILFAFQPIIFQFSFRCYAEMLAGLLITLTIYFYYRKKFLLSAFFSTYLFAVRQEYAIVSIIMGVIFILPLIRGIFKSKSESENSNFSLLRDNILPFLLLLLSPLVLNLVGYIKTGDPIWLLNDMKHYGIDIAVPRVGFWHYFKMYIFIVGPVTFVLLLLGYFYLISERKNLRKVFQQYGLIFLIFTIIFFIHVLMAWKELELGGSTGALRFLIPLSPLAAIISGIGLNIIIKGYKKYYIYAIMFFLVILTVFFLSFKFDGFSTFEEKDYSRAAVIFLLLLFSVFLMEYKLNHNVFFSFITVIAIGYTLIYEKPIKLDPERKAAQSLAIWWEKEYNEGKKPTLCNHIFFYHSLGAVFGEDKRFGQLTKAGLQSAPIGTICIWDLHYSNRPEYKTDTPLEFFVNNPNFREFDIYDKFNLIGKHGGYAYAFCVFEKVKNYR